MDSRDWFYFFCIVGTNGAGKTKFVLDNFISKSSRRSLCVDPDLMEDAFDPYPIIDIKNEQEMRSFKGVRRAACEDPEDIALIRKNFQGGNLLLDDFGYYTDSNIPKDLRRIIVRRRQMKLDIFALTQGFTEIPPKFITRATHIVVFKSNDNPEVHKHKLRNFDKFMQMVNEVNNHPDPHYYQIINIRDFLKTSETETDEDED